ncbi:MAG: hypothetical protein H0U42_04135 [Thermoleophilaceae bacterium]|nr:hypothetical protein [Thermoleophilaceae bacterium]
MCVQCWTAAATAGTAATGFRAYLAARSPAWLSERRLRGLTAALGVFGVLGASIALV